ncbi:MAG: T9SS type A sorting domain-containing protein [Bacteroidota bacterium]
MKTLTLAVLMLVTGIAASSQNICPSSFKRNNGNGTCGSLGELRLNFSPACPASAPIIDSVYTNNVKSDVKFNAPNDSHCGGNNGYISYCVTSGNMPPANVWTIYFHTADGSNYSCLVTSSGGNILPIKYSSFDAIISGAAITCNWTTEQEMNNNYFELERSFDGAAFKTIAIIFSNNGNSNTKQQYKYKDNGTAVKNQQVMYYRIKQVDIDGNATYSKIIMVQLVKNTTNELQVSPNPFVQNIIVKVNATENGIANIILTNTQGQKVIVKKTSINKGSNNMSVNDLQNLAKGMYFMQVSINGNISGYQKILKN